MRFVAFILVALTIVLVRDAAADQEASNIPHVQSSTYGRCYAKSVPEEYWGQKGVTRLYRVGKDGDRLVATYPWFSQRLYLQCNMSIDGRIGGSVVRLGPWSRGRRASADHLALAFYFDDELLVRYSTLDIAGAPDNVSASVSHYIVIDKVTGYRRLQGNDHTFDVETTDGRTLSFDPKTGMLRAAP